MPSKRAARKKPPSRHATRPPVLAMLDDEAGGHLRGARGAHWRSSPSTGRAALRFMSLLLGAFADAGVPAGPPVSDTVPGDEPDQPSSLRSWRRSPRCRFHGSLKMRLRQRTERQVFAFARSASSATRHRRRGAGRPRPLTPRSPSRAHGRGAVRPALLIQRAVQEGSSTSGVSTWSRRRSCAENSCARTSSVSSPTTTWPASVSTNASSGSGRARCGA